MPTSTFTVLPAMAVSGLVLLSGWKWGWRPPRADIPGQLALVLCLLLASLNGIAWVTGAPTVWLMGSETFDGGLAEWLTFFAILLVCAQLLRLASGRAPWWLKITLLVSAAAAFFIASEEISWGQWIFHWKAEGVFATHNLQSETNLHNFVDPRKYDSVYMAIGWIILASLLVSGAVMKRENSALLALPGSILWRSWTPLLLMISAVALQTEAYEEVSEALFAIAAAVMLSGVRSSASPPFFSVRTSSAHPSRPEAFGEGT